MIVDDFRKCEYLIIDDLDLFILKKIYFSEGDVNNWDFTKEWLRKRMPCVDFSTKEGSRKLSLEYTKVKNKLKKMEKWGVILISKNSKKNIYNLIEENVRIGKHRFPDCFRESIQLKICGKWRVVQL